MRQWIFTTVLIFALVILTNLGSPAFVAIFWKMIGWTIFLSFIGGVVALPCYSFKLLFSAAIRNKLSSRQTLYFNSLGLAPGVSMLVLVLGAFAYF